MRPCSVLRFGTVVAVSLISTTVTHAGQNYFISPTGSDSNPGTQDKPFASIQKGLTLAKPGDSVSLLTGVYRDQSASFVRSGTAAAPITLQAAPGAAVTIKGSDVLSGWTRQGTSDVYVHSNFNHYFGSWNANASDARGRARNQLFIDGAYVQEVSSQSALRPGTFYLDKASKNVYVQTADRANPSKKTVEASVTSGPLLATNGFDNLVVRGLNFAHNANLPQDNATVQVRGGSDNVLIDRVSVQYAAGAGISVGGNNNVIQNSRFNYNGQQGIHSANTNNLLVKNSETSYNNTLAGKQFDPGWEAGGNKFVRSKNAVVDGLVSHHNIGSGIWFDINNQNATIRNSISHHNGKGIHYEISHTGKIYNNLVYKNQYQYDTVSFNPLKFEPNSPSAYGIYVSSSDGVEVFNNTVVENDRSGISVTGPIRDDGDGHKAYSYAAVLKNNLVAMNAAYTGPLASGKTRDSFEYQVYNAAGAAVDPALGSTNVVPFVGNKSDYNMFFLRNGGKTQTASSFGFNSWNDQTLAKWRTRTGQDTHSLIGNPLFIDAANEDYRLLPNSAAWGKGTRIPGLIGSENIGVNFSMLSATDIPEPGIGAIALVVSAGVIHQRRR